MKADIEIESEQQRLRPEKSEVERLRADNGKALALLDFEPEYSGPEGLRRGLEETVQWFIKPENLSLYKADIYNI
jgi:dTDP-glucose 4,6-dehydratase